MTGKITPYYGFDDVGGFCRAVRFLLIGFLLMGVLAGCSTRQVTDTLEGSTAQRLVTYSLENFIAELVNQPELSHKDTAVHMQIYFLNNHPMVDYARQLLTIQLELQHGIKVIPADEPADYQVDVFFNSIGTDLDSFGLSIPTFGLAFMNARADVLALDMFHGVTEGHAIVKRKESGDIARTKRVLARVRRDNVSTPVIEFPLNQLD